jgi:hypothetical protein
MAPASVTILADCEFGSIEKEFRRFAEISIWRAIMEKTVDFSNTKTGEMTIDIMRCTVYHD